MNGSEWSTKKLMTCRFQRASHSPACWWMAGVPSTLPHRLASHPSIHPLCMASVSLFNWFALPWVWRSAKRRTSAGGDGRVGSGRTGLIGVHCYFRETVSSVNRLTHFLVSRKFWFNRLKVGQIDGREGENETATDTPTHASSSIHSHGPGRHPCSCE